MKIIQECDVDWGRLDRVAWCATGATAAVVACCLALYRSQSAVKRGCSTAVALPLAYLATRLLLKPKKVDWDRALGSLNKITPEVKRTVGSLLPSQIARLLTWLRAASSVDKATRLCLLDHLNADGLKAGGRDLVEQFVDTTVALASGHSWSRVVQPQKFAVIVPNLSTKRLHEGYIALFDLILSGQADDDDRAQLPPLVAATTLEQRKELLKNFYDKRVTRMHELHTLTKHELLYLCEFKVTLCTSNSLTQEQLAHIEEWERVAHPH